ncbi:MAG: sensor histidine kinase [Chloroflexota bacterium]
MTTQTHIDIALGTPQDKHMEPGVLDAFRMYGVMRIFVVSVIYSTTSYILIGTVPLQIFSFGLAGGIVLLAYLMSDRLRGALGRWYLPGAFIWAAGDVVLVEKFLSRSLPAAAAQLMAKANAVGRAPLAQILSMLEYSAVTVSPPAFVLIILICWQYHFRAGLMFALAVGLLDTAYQFVTVDTTTTSLWFVIISILPRTVALVLISWFVSRLVSVQRRQRSALIAANVQLADYAATHERLTISRERNRMARELHDTLAHTLSASSVQLEVIDALMEDDPPKAKLALSRALQVTRDGLHETRRALKDLRATPLDDLGLNLALTELGYATQRRTSATVMVETPDELPQLTDALEQMIYRVSQEALNNAARHAHATCIVLALARTPNTLCLSITDDGVGFDAASVNTEEHFGLAGMAERAAALGAMFNVYSQPGRGTTIKLEMGL